MVASLKTTNKELADLYESDYSLWVLETVKLLQNRDFQSLDLENLIEEVGDLSRRDQKKLKNLLKRLLEHLLKLKYWESEVVRNQAHWKGEILNFRQQIRDELQDSPSLRPFLKQIFDDCYEDARKIASIRANLALDIFPEDAIASLEQILDEDWLP
jgi:DNA repair ATPase RecN